MSFTDPAADPAQPEVEGQGGEASGGSPWESYLTRFPEDLRDVASEAFREMEGHATKRFQDHAEYRKTWEPYEQLGVNQIAPEDVSWALQFRQAAVENPQSVWEWAQNYAKEHGLTPAETAALEEQTLDEFGLQDPSKQLEQLLEQRLGPLAQKFEQFESRFQQQDQREAEAKALQYIEGQLSELETKHPGEFNREAVELFLPNFIETDPEQAVPRAFEAYQNMRNQIEKQALQGKVNAPAPAEGGGIPDVSPEKFSRIDAPGVKDAAVEFLRNSNRA